MAALIGTVHVFFAPRQAPLHERNLQPLAGVAVSATGLNDGNAAEQRGRHVMPTLELRTAPFPLTATDNRKDAGANAAVTAAPGVTPSTHPAAPVHAPLQRTSFAPAPGVALSASRCPEFHVVVQLVAAQEPGHVGGHRAGPGDRDRERRLAVEPHEPRRVLRVRPAARVTVVVVRPDRGASRRAPRPRSPET